MKIKIKIPCAAAALEPASTEECLEALRLENAHQAALRLEARRREFVRRIWAWANERGHTAYATALFDAGELGFCLLKWVKCGWTHQWFDRAEKI